MKLIALLICITFLTSCVGIVAIGKNKETYGSHDVWLGVSKQLDKLPTPNKQLTKAEVIQKFGEPDEKVKEGELERWIYIRESSWTGIMPFIIIPIPLMIPTGHYKTSMTFTGDQLTKAECETKAVTQFLCGLVTPDGFKLFCENY